jgi:signal transduction histidine kinase
MMRSLRARLFAAACVSTIAALAIAAIAIGGVLREAVTRGFMARLEGSLLAIAAGLERDETSGALSLETEPPDPRFGVPLSGWYWQVAETDGTVRFASPSLWNATLGEAAGPRGEALLRERRQLSVPGGGGAVEITVAAPLAELEEEVSTARRPVLLSVALLGVALLLAAWVQLSFGLRPLMALRQDIAAIRAGRISALPAARFTEAAPLVEDLNALLAHDAAMVERARRNAGDLAHGLKTPLAAILNAAEEPGRDPDGVIAAAARRMEAQLRHHLQRARIAGAVGVPGACTPVAPVLEDLAFMLRRAHARPSLEITLTTDAPDFAGARQDLEEMAGNLMDNACKWARGRVHVEARAAPGGLLVAVADDGPGMPAADRAAALMRGGRLDESQPGQGFGLAIVAETAALYGGRLELADAAPGLLAKLYLPALQP